MEDRFALVQIPVPHLPNENIVRLFCVMDGHGGQVRNTFHNMSDNISELDFLRLLEFCKVECHPRYSTGKSFSEVLILASVNPQYDKRLFIEFLRKRQIQNMLCTKIVFLFLF